jgi:hypothetical protein
LTTSIIYAEDIKYDKVLTQKIEKVIEETNTLKPGMTRTDLLDIFTEEGGISTRTWRRYAYRGCPYIKVDVEFKPVGNEEDKLHQSLKDIITKISKPFLELSIID